MRTPDRAAKSAVRDQDKPQGMTAKRAASFAERGPACARTAPPKIVLDRNQRPTVVRGVAGRIVGALALDAQHGRRAGRGRALRDREERRGGYEKISNAHRLRSNMVLQLTKPAIAGRTGGLRGPATL